MDIKNVADLLREFVAAETEILNKQDIKHPTTIGAMYEGLSATVVDKAIFDGLNLKIYKNSFIKGCDKEFDILLVEGEGEIIPHTERYKFNPEQVIVVISVKKNLYSKDLEDGYDNLKSLISHYEDVIITPYMFRLYRDAFRMICRKDISTLKAGELNKNEENIYHILKFESVLPVRILLGYNGFKRESNFRESFQEYLASKLTTDANNKISGGGPHNFPNLIICDQFSMLKLNGMPSGLPIEKEGWWPVYVSSSYNPMYFFLEAIWSRLSYKFNLPDTIFGEDLSMEPISRFLDCRIKELNGMTGWEYNYCKLDEKTLKSNIEVTIWSPVELDKAQFSVLNAIRIKGEIDLLTDKDIEPFVIQESYPSLKDFIEKFTATGLVFVENNKLKFLTDQCVSTSLPNGKMVAGEDKSGRFSRWVFKHGNEK
jgi:hypothetical protein